MATPNYTEEEIQFRKRARRRLVGAVVLVALVVAVVPMILPENKPQQDSQAIDIRIPSQDATGYAPKILPAPGAEQTASDTKPTVVPPSALKAAPAAPVSASGKPNTESVPVLNAPKSNDVKLEQTPAPQAEMKSTPPTQAATEPQTPTKPADNAKQTYFVQYGAFTEMKNAKQRQTDLKGKGVNTFTEVVKTTAGDKIRVRSGPYAAREQADKVREKVKPLDSKLVVMGNNG